MQALVQTGLDKATRLQTLCLAGNRLSTGGAKAVAQLLTGTDAQQPLQLVELDVSWNNIQGEGACDLLAAMEQAQTLTTVDMSWNPLGSEPPTGGGVGTTAQAQDAEAANGDAPGAAPAHASPAASIPVATAAAPGGADSLGTALAVAQAVMTLAPQNTGVLPGERVARQLRRLFRSGRSASNSSSLTHLDLSHTALSSDLYELLRSGLAPNRSLLGLHLHGRCWVVAWCASVVAS